MLSIKKMLTKILQELVTLRTATTTTFVNATPGTAAVIQNANQKRCKLVKTGKNVRCYVGIGYADGTTAIPANTTLFTIPSGYRPKERQIFPCAGYRSVGKTVSPGFEFNVDGTIKHNSGSDITMLVGSAEWETN